MKISASLSELPIPDTASNMVKQYVTFFGGLTPGIKL
jgi:hypothetical protein